MKNETEPEDVSKCICLHIQQISHRSQHVIAHCKLVSGNLNCSTVLLLLASERWSKAGIEAGHVISVYHPWYIHRGSFFKK